MSEIRVTIVVDTPDNWIMPYVGSLINELKRLNHTVSFVQHHNDIKPGDIAFFLSCENIVPKETLSKNRHNLVVHESALPQGKGWSPLTWQILEGKGKIPITLFEAVEKVDAGQIYFQDIMTFEGHELIEELRDLQGRKTIELCLKFIDHYPNVASSKQTGAETFYSRRKPKDSRIYVNRTIADLFNNFRVADNIRYPVFFEHTDYRYSLKIEKIGKASEKTNVSSELEMTPRESYEADMGN